MVKTGKPPLHKKQKMLTSRSKRTRHVTFMQVTKLSQLTLQTRSIPINVPLLATCTCLIDKIHPADTNTNISLIDKFNSSSYNNVIHDYLPVLLSLFYLTKATVKKVVKRTIHLITVLSQRLVLF